MHGVDYPFGAPAGAGVLDSDGGWSPYAGSVDLAGRAPVVAAGSNAVPAVVHGKLKAAGVGGSVPFAVCEVAGLAVAHSAHVSPGGYVPLTAYAAGGATSRLVVSWFLPEQLAALDASEPNYVRVPVPADDAMVYASRWGVLAPAGTPVRATTQAAVQRGLRADPQLAAWLPDDPSEAVDALREPELARRVRDRVAALGWARASGLV